VGPKYVSGNAGFTQCTGGIDKTVLVQAYSAYKYDNSYTADCAVTYPGHFASVNILDPLQKDTPDNLSYWVRERGTRGLRLFATMETEGTWLDDPQTFPVWERAGSLGIPTPSALAHFLLRLERRLGTPPNSRC